MIMLRHSSPKARGGFFMVDPSSSGLAQTHDTLQCKHCGAHWEIDPGSGRQRGWCGNCSGPTCGGKRCTEICEPMEKALERWEAEYAVSSDYARILNEMAAERSPLAV